MKKYIFNNHPIYLSKAVFFQLVFLIINLSIILFAVLWGAAKEELSMKFEEYGLITNFSVGQLLLIGLVNLFLYLNDKKSIWALITIGFTFLAFDEKLRIHENIDFLIHSVLNLKETPLTDKIDDFIILLYGLVGLFFLIKNRQLFIKNKTGMVFLSIGFALMALMVTVDTLTNDGSQLYLTVNSIITAETFKQLGTIMEESLKIISECFLLGGFLSYLTKKQVNH